ncbi:MAG TPA: hypothetical protein VMZ31_20080 [Phycisphaerae bacterium]|nr:hypothetical protein [Phycisphaerae bacterium]
MDWSLVGELAWALAVGLGLVVASVTLGHSIGRRAERPTPALPSEPKEPEPGQYAAIHNDLQALEERTNSQLAAMAEELAAAWGETDKLSKAHALITVERAYYSAVVKMSLFAAFQAWGQAKGSPRLTQEDIGRWAGILAETPMQTAALTLRYVNLALLSGATSIERTFMFLDGVASAMSKLVNGGHKQVPVDQTEATFLDQFITQEVPPVLQPGLKQLKIVGPARSPLPPMIVAIPRTRSADADTQESQNG